MTDATAKRLAWGLFTLCCLFYLADILVPLVARAQVGIRPLLAADGHGTRDHPRDQRGDFQPSVRTLVCGHPQVPVGQLVEPGRTGQSQTGTSPAADTRFGSSNTAEVAR